MWNWLVRSVDERRAALTVLRSYTVGIIVHHSCNSYLNGQYPTIHILPISVLKLVS